MRALSVAVLLSCGVALVAAQALPSFNAALDNSTVSGLSSGAFFAVQMHVAYSSTLKGVAVFAGGPYDCAEGSEMNALMQCMNALPNPPNPQTSIFTTDLRAKAGSIDGTENLAASYAYLYSGVFDSTVNPKVMQALNTYYLNYLPSDHILFTHNISSAHTQPTDDPINTEACIVSKSPFISNCHFDGAGVALNFIFGAPLPNARNDGTLSGKVISFSQSQYVPSGSSLSSLSLAQTGYAYVPESCSNGEECRVHMSFHGCEQSHSYVGMDYVEHTGYNKWADTNGIVVVYPQTASSLITPSNPNACWDWWGFAGSNYDVKAGGQAQFAMNVLKALAPN